MALPKRMVFITAGIIFLSGCGGATVKKETQYFNDEKIDIVEIAETTPQIAYQETVSSIVAAMKRRQTTFELSFKSVNSGGKVFILPEIKQRQPIDWQAVLALIQRTPTTGENWKNGLIEGLKNLGIPLAIAGMATVSVQAARTSELISPDNTNISGGDQSQGESMIDKSTKTEESFNTPTEESFNTTTELLRNGIK